MILLLQSCFDWTSVLLHEVLYLMWHNYKLINYPQNSILFNWKLPNIMYTALNHIHKFRFAQEKSLITYHIEYHKQFSELHKNRTKHINKFSLHSVSSSIFFVIWYLRKTRLSTYMYFCNLYDAVTKNLDVLPW